MILSKTDIVETFSNKCEEQYVNQNDILFKRGPTNENIITADMNVVGGTTVVILIIIEIEAQITYYAETEAPPKKDYRPDKWLATTATDIWFGKQTLADILGKDFNEMVKRTIRVGRSTTNHILKYKQLNTTINSAPKELINQILYRIRQNNTKF